MRRIYKCDFRENRKVRTGPRRRTANRFSPRRARALVVRRIPSGRESRKLLGNSTYTRIICSIDRYTLHAYNFVMTIRSRCIRSCSVYEPRVPICIRKTEGENRQVENNNYKHFPEEAVRKKKPQKKLDIIIMNGMTGRFGRIFRLHPSEHHTSL